MPTVVPELAKIHIQSAGTEDANVKYSSSKENAVSSLIKTFTTLKKNNNPNIRELLLKQFL